MYARDSDGLEWAQGVKCYVQATPLWLSVARLAVAEFCQMAGAKVPIKVLVRHVVRVVHTYRYI